jgi:hypothetical protein
MALHPDVLDELAVEKAAREAAKPAAASSEPRSSYVDDLEVRLSGINASLAAAVPWKALPGIVIEAFNHYTAKMVEPLREQIRSLQAETKELKEREHLGIRYCGAWRPAKFGVGDLVTYGGSLWHSNATTTTKPGTNDDWTLIVRRGRDGRDAGAQRAQPDD